MLSFFSSCLLVSKVLRKSFQEMVCLYRGVRRHSKRQLPELGFLVSLTGYLVEVEGTVDHVEDDRNVHLSQVIVKWGTVLASAEADPCGSWLWFPLGPVVRHSSLVGAYEISCWMGEVAT